MRQLSFFNPEKQHKNIVWKGRMRTKNKLAMDMRPAAFDDRIPFTRPASFAPFPFHENTNRRRVTPFPQCSIGANQCDRRLF